MRVLARDVQGLISYLIEDSKMENFDRVIRLDLLSKACSSMRDAYAHQRDAVAETQSRNSKDSSELLACVTREDSQIQYVMETFWTYRKKCVNAVIDELGSIAAFFQ